MVSWRVKSRNKLLNGGADTLLWESLESYRTKSISCDALTMFGELLSLNWPHMNEWRANQQHQDTIELSTIIIPLSLLVFIVFGVFTPLTELQSVYLKFYLIFVQTATKYLRTSTPTAGLKISFLLIFLATKDLSRQNKSNHALRFHIGLILPDISVNYISWWYLFLVRKMGDVPGGSSSIDHVQILQSSRRPSFLL